DAGVRVDARGETPEEVTPATTDVEQTSVGLLRVEDPPHHVEDRIGAVPLREARGFLPPPEFLFVKIAQWLRVYRAGSVPGGSYPVCHWPHPCSSRGIPDAFEASSQPRGRDVSLAPFLSRWMPSSKRSSVIPGGSERSPQSTGAPQKEPGSPSLR